MELIAANVVFWSAWYVVSSIPFLAYQYTIDNYEKIYK